MDTSSEPGGRLTAFGNQLIDVHIWLREELATLRTTLVEGDTSQGDGAARDLRAHCLAFCAAVTRHHSGEDEGAFPVLAERFPELRPVLEELRRDHEAVAEILRRVAGLPAGTQAALTELDGLSALLESHFVYEEKRIVTALNALDERTWDGIPEFLEKPGDST